MKIDNLFYVTSVIMTKTDKFLEIPPVPLRHNVRVIQVESLDLVCHPPVVQDVELGRIPELLRS